MYSIRVRVLATLNTNPGLTRSGISISIKYKALLIRNELTTRQDTTRQDKTELCYLVLSWNRIYIDALACFIGECHDSK